MFDMAQSDEPESKRARFSKVDGDFLAKIREESVAAATKRTTSSWVNVFKDYLSEQGINIELQEVTGSELRIVLERFYVEARRQDGKPYQKSSILGIRAAIQRHLHAVGRLDLNIITGEDFVGANQTLDAFLKHLAKEGELQATQHKEPISKEDLEKLFSFFYSEGYKNPRVLTQAVWFFTTYHFGLRSREVQSNMKISYLLFAKIGDRECIKLAAEFRTKNHQGGTVTIIGERLLGWTNHGPEAGSSGEVPPPQVASRLPVLVHETAGRLQMDVI